ncbi:hypothetical protein [Enterovirga aerilata]|uniref:Uncharacterized protein n=1 Tax=Enterovirga aerilata TaxID=2730920 RepID=A0A849I488_9HYPH|nr:hypothetical protein [Enterovirga sp. DB1703]NNM74242.1 hypothetical protein [Enterovirga sp. DB1703]
MAGLALWCRRDRIQICEAKPDDDDDSFIEPREKKLVPVAGMRALERFCHIAPLQLTATNLSAVIIS